MSASMRVQRRTAAASAATVLVLGGLWFGSGDAAADEPTPDGIQADIAALVCAELDAGVARVRADIGALVTVGLTDTDEAVLNGLLADKVAALDCDAVAPTPPVTTTPTVPPTTPPTSAPPPPLVDRDCDDFPSQAAAQVFYDLVATPGDRDPANLDRDGDGVACELDEGAPGTGDDGVVDPRADDGSTADTDGSQVIEVPQGSAATGSA